MRKKYPSCKKEIYPTNNVKYINGQKYILIGINERVKRLYKGFLQLYIKK